MVALVAPRRTPPPVELTGWCVAGRRPGRSHLVRVRVRVRVRVGVGVRDRVGVGVRVRVRDRVRDRVRVWPCSP